MNKLNRLLPHLNLVLSFVMVTLLVIDMFFNSAMGFIDNLGAKWIMLVLCFFVIINSFYQIVQNTKRKKK